MLLQKTIVMGEKKDFEGLELSYSFRNAENSVPYDSRKEWDKTKFIRREEQFLDRVD